MARQADSPLLSCFFIFRCPLALLGLAVKFLISLALWPLAAFMGWALAKLCWALPWAQGKLPWFAGGILAYLLFQVLVSRPVFLYVMGHELTHALAAWLQGGKADDMHVSTKGGKVKVNRSNFMVNLAPYFFPIYTALASLAWLIATDGWRRAVAVLLGLTLAFHFALTFFSLREHQSDVSEVGWLFAIPLILVLNALITALVLCLVAGSGPFLAQFFHDTWTAAVTSAAWVHARF